MGDVCDDCCEFDPTLVIVLVMTMVIRMTEVTLMTLVMMFVMTVADVMIVVIITVRMIFIQESDDVVCDLLIMIFVFHANVIDDNEDIKDSKNHNIDDYDANDHDNNNSDSNT